MARSCEGLVALVVGASRRNSCGRGIATRLAAEGAKVAVSARSVDGLKETLTEIEAVGGTGLMLPADVGY